MAINTPKTPEILDTKSAQKFLVKKGKQGGRIHGEDEEIIRSIKQNQLIYSELKEDEKELLDILREYIENNLDWRFLSKLENKLREKKGVEFSRIAKQESMHGRTMQQFTDIVDARVEEECQDKFQEINDQIKEYHTKKDAQMDKLSKFLNLHSRFNSQFTRNFLIAIALSAVLIGGVVVKDKLDGIKWRKEQARLEALRMQEQGKDWHVIIQDAVQCIQGARNQSEADDLVNKYGNLIEKKRDTLRMQKDSIFSGEIIGMVSEFEKMHPEQAKSFFAQFFNNSLSDGKSNINARQLESLLSPYEKNIDISVPTRDFLTKLINQLKSYSLSIEEIDQTYANFINEIVKAKKSKYQQLGVVEDKGAQTANAPLKQPEKNVSEKKEKMHQPAHKYDYDFLVTDIIEDKTNLSDLETKKATRNVLRLKIQERDQKKRNIDNQKTQKEDEAKNKNKKFTAKQIQELYRLAEDKKGFYEYAKALFVQAILSNEQHGYSYGHKKNTLVKYEDALVDTLAKGQEVEVLNEERDHIKDAGEQITKDDFSLIDDIFKTKKSEIDNQYLKYQEELEMLENIIQDYQQVLTGHINTLGPILEKPRIQESLILFQQWQKKLETEYAVRPEDVKNIIRYRLDAMFFSYNFENIDVLKKFIIYSQRISILSGLSPKEIYGIAAPYIREDMLEVNKKDLPLWKAIVQKQAIHL